MGGKTKKRIALVTGGTRGIGASIAIALKDAGYRVAATYAHNDEAAKAFHKETGVEVFKWDVSNGEECVKGVARVEKKMDGVVDVLVNNAGITRDAMIHKLTPDKWHDVIETNLSSCFYMSQAVIGAMREREFGRIINISSVNAQLGQLGQTNYSAAKAGIIGFSKALAREVARKGVTVNVIAPGYIETEMVQAVSKDVLKQIVDMVPVKRLGQPEEVARCVLFLADDAAGFITGETLSVNGGLHME